MPKFSLAIPTLRRAETLAHALASLSAQSGDLEIIVQNNGNDPATRALIETAADPRVRHFHTDQVVPMAENWELALAHANGDWITFIGDDDGLLPDACAIAADVLGRADTEILSWEPALYYWPGFVEARRANTLQVTLDEFVVRRELARPLLEKFYRFEVHYSKLPMLYNSFVSRSLVDRVRARHGAYFIGSLPDVSSGIVDAAACNTFLKSTRPLSVAGTSRHSTGHSFLYAAADLDRDFPLLADERDLVRSNLEAAIGVEMLLVQDRLEDPTLEFSVHGWIRSVAAAINNVPARYHATLSLIAAMADRFDVDLSDVAIPERVDPTPIRRRGPTFLGDRVVLLVIDGGTLGIGSIDGAARLAQQLLPSADEVAFADLTVPATGIPPVSRHGIRFSRGEPGTYALFSGWGDPEPWGSWSTDRVSTLRLAVPEGNGASRLALELRYRTIPLPGGEPRVVECCVGGRTVHRWEFFDFNASGDLLIEVPEAVAAETVDVTFVNHNARSPRELGIGPDVRQLGIGIEQIRLCA